MEVFVKATMSRDDVHCSSVDLFVIAECSFKIFDDVDVFVAECQFGPVCPGPSAIQVSRFSLPSGDFVVDQAFNVRLWNWAIQSILYNMAGKWLHIRKMFWFLMSDLLSAHVNNNNKLKSIQNWAALNQYSVHSRDKPEYQEKTRKLMLEKYR